MDSFKRFRYARFVLAFSVLVMGACGIIYEYVLASLGNNLMGSSYEQIFVIIGLMMFAMGLGATIQKGISKNLIDVFLTVELLLGLIGGLSSIVVYMAFVFTASYQIVLYLFAFSVGILIGLEIPILIRVNSKYSESLSVNLSDILCMDYVGSLAGALVFTYVLLTRLSLGRIGAVLGCVNIALAVGALLYFRSLVRWPKLLTIMSLVSLTLLVFAFINADRWMAGFEQRCFEDPIIHSQTSKYQHLVITQRGERTRLYINGHLQFNSLDEAIYHEMLVHVPMSLAARKNNILILGGGDGLALRDVLKYGDVDKVTLVDIDPAIIKLASENPAMIELNQAAFHDSRVFSHTAAGTSGAESISVFRQSRLADNYIGSAEYKLADIVVYTIDADLFVRRIEQDYDVIIIDFPDPRSHELCKLYSVDFYINLKGILSPDGIISVQSTSPVKAKKIFMCIGKTLESAGFKVLPYHENVPSFGEWGWHLAWLNKEPTDQVRQRISDIGEFRVDTSYITANIMDASFEFGKGWLDCKEAIKANTKFNPVILKYHKDSFKY